MRTVVPFALVACALISGCTDSGSYHSGNQATINFGGSGSGSDAKEIECDDDGYVTSSLGGQGSLTVTVTDSTGKTLYTDTAGGSGGSSDSQSLEGAPGTWRLAASWTHVNGGLSITLQC